MWLLTLMVVPALLLLLFLMEWLDTHLTERLIADDVEAALARIANIHELEAAISERTAPLFTAHRL